MLLYKFMKNGKQVNGAYAENQSDAIKINGGIDYDTIETEPILSGQPEVVKVFQSKVRKPRADKGQPHQKKETPIKSRRQPDYFIFANGTLVKVLSRDKVPEAIEAVLPGTLRIIMGHEITFTRQTRLHLK